MGPRLILISAAAASFGGHSGLAWMSNLLHSPRIPNAKFQMPEIERSWGWVIAAVILAILFIAGLGLGVKFHSTSGHVNIPLTCGHPEAPALSPAGQEPALSKVEGMRQPLHC